mgnify:CR=1 FL=1
MRWKVGGGYVTLTTNSLDFELEAKNIKNATVNAFYLEGVTYNLKSIALKFTKDIHDI